MKFSPNILRSRWYHFSLCQKKNKVSLDLALDGVAKASGVDKTDMTLLAPRPSTHTLPTYFHHIFALHGTERQSREQQLSIHVIRQSISGQQIIPPTTA